MNKSELELQNIQSIIDEMPVAERALCVSMVSSLMASVGHPVHGRVFMIAVAFTNCQVAVHNIKMGLVNEDGSIPEKFMHGDGKVNRPTLVAVKVNSSDNAGTIQEKIDNLAGFHSGGYVGDNKLKEGEVEAQVPPVWATHKLQDHLGAWHYVKEGSKAHQRNGVYYKLGLSGEIVQLFNVNNYVDGSLTALDISGSLEA